MNISLQNNLLAMNSSRMYKITTGKRAKSTEKLSSGYRINRAADDAAGLAISEKMRRQIKGLDQASRNIQDGISFAQVADGCLNEVQDILQRINQLAIQSANGTQSDQDRAYLDEEVQALKKETNRIFKKSEFNEMRIWHVPYAPEPELLLDKEPDIQVYNSGVESNGLPVWGGVEINHVRHTWDELQIGISDETGFFGESDDFEFNDYTGERVKIKTQAGDAPPFIKRNYNWEAKEEGIFVNNVLAATWDEVKNEDSGEAITFPVASGEYSFEFRNFKISFDVPDYDDQCSKEDLIDNISGTASHTSYTWDLSVTALADSETAVIATGKAQQVTNANQYIIDNEYKIKATQEGLSLVDTNITPPKNDPVKDEGSIEHTLYHWLEPKDEIKEDHNEFLSGADESFPITDFGLSDMDKEGVNSDEITFDDKVTYTFIDKNQPRLPIEFTFSMKDETSLDAVMAAFDGATITDRITAPGTADTRISSSSDKSPVVTLKSDYLSGNFELQREYERDFDDRNAPLSGYVDRKLKAVSEYGPVDGQAKNVKELSSWTREEETVYIKGEDNKYYKLSKKESGNEVGYDLAKTYTRSFTYEYSGEFKGYDIDKITDSGSATKTENYHMIDIETQTVYDYVLDGSGNKVIYNELPEGASVVTDLSFDKIGEIIYDKSNKTTEDRGTSYTYEEKSIDILTEKGKALTIEFSNGYEDVGDAKADVNWKATGFAYRDCNVNMKTADPDRNVSRGVNLTGVKLLPPERTLYIQSGVEAGQGITMKWDALNNAVIGIAGTTVRSQSEAGAAIDQVKEALKIVSKQRSDFGAYQNRFEHAININKNVSENTSYAESQIRDTDMAEEMVQYSNQGILEQAGVSMIAQANQSRQGILSLLG